MIVLVASATVISAVLLARQLRQAEQVPATELVRTDTRRAARRPPQTPENWHR